MKTTRKLVISKCLILLWVNMGSPTWGLLAPSVTTQQGRVRGLRSPLGHNQYYSIRYASAERFQLPKEPPSWDGVYNAFNPFKTCVQSFFGFVIGSEDCLYLDVYSPPSAAGAGRLPVLVFIHGGAYYYGGKTIYNPEFLVNKNVIVVTINYRLSVYGFLCVNGVSNLGLRDQVAALKWIQKNIAAFGGDPDNVTLCGQSAGAASVSMHSLSKESSGLFHKAILMSGSALTPWAFNLDPITPASEDARKISDVCNEEDIFNAFLSASKVDLTKATIDTSVNQKYFKYSPCVDSNSTDPFFHDKPYNIMKSGSFNAVPTMIGYTDSEGITFQGLIDPDTYEQLDKHFVERISSIFSWCSDDDKRKVAKRIRSYYFGKGRITKESFRGFVEYFSDWVVHGSIHAYSKLLMESSDQPVFNYQFSYIGGRNFFKQYTSLPIPGAAHGDDLSYVFKTAGLPLLLSNPDKLIIDQITTIFTNFMKFGNPTPTRTTLLPIVWPPAAPNATNTLRLDKQLSIVEDHRENFFQKLLCDYGESGHVPCDSAEKCRRRKRSNKALC